MSMGGASRQPPRFLTDANFNLHIVAGLRRLQADIDIVTAQSHGVTELSDHDLLRFAMRFDRILLTHDRRTMYAHLKTLLRTLAPGEHSPGVISLAQTLPVGAAIEAILLVWICGEHVEWRDQFTYLPL